MKQKDLCKLGVYHVSCWAENQAVGRTGFISWGSGGEFVSLLFLKPRGHWYFGDPPRPTQISLTIYIIIFLFYLTIHLDSYEFIDPTSVIKNHLPISRFLTESHCKISFAFSTIKLPLNIFRRLVSGPLRIPRSRDVSLLYKMMKYFHICPFSCIFQWLADL